MIFKVVLEFGWRKKILIREFLEIGCSGKEFKNVNLFRFRLNIFKLL